MFTFFYYFYLSRFFEDCHVGGEDDIKLKGIVHQFFSNLIFWIVMVCGIADVGGRGL